LAGVRVVDLSRLLPGPFCSWILASLGAEVIRVEPPGGGDYSRALPPIAQGHGVFFAALNRGKQSVALDVRTPQGHAALLALLETADVLLEGFKPGALARSGLAPEVLLERFPDLVIASITGFGQQGALTLEPGHDLNYCGYAGIVAASERLEPVAVQVADLAGGALTAAAGISAALVGVARGTGGRHLDVSMTHGALALMAPQLAMVQADDRDLVPDGELLTGGMGLYRSYRCADDRLLTVGPLEPKFWALLQAQLPDAPAAPDAAALAALFCKEPLQHWVDTLKRCCVGPALRARELPEHPVHAGRFESVLGVPMARAPFPWSPAPVVPELGAHTVQVLGPLVDVDALLASGCAHQAGGRGA
jgi:crotonobetainyl-CoA:carnitine CoA-transferase CaiB-like acyl-CoA transferase